MEKLDKTELMKLMMFMERSRKDFLEAREESDQVRAVIAVASCSKPHHPHTSGAHFISCKHRF